MSRRLTEEEKAERRKQYNIKQNEKYHLNMQNPEFREKERLRAKERRAKRTPEQREIELQKMREYSKERRIMYNELGLPIMTEEQKSRKLERQREAYNRRYKTDSAFRKKAQKKSRATYRKRKARLEEEGFQRRLAMSRAANEILN